MHEADLTVFGGLDKKGVLSCRDGNLCEKIEGAFVEPLQSTGWMWICLGTFRIADDTNAEALERSKGQDSRKVWLQSGACILDGGGRDRSEMTGTSLCYVPGPVVLNNSASSSGLGVSGMFG